MGGVTGADDEVGLWESLTRAERRLDAGERTFFPGDGNPVDLAGNASRQCVRKSERLVFMARLAITQQPDGEEFRHCGGRMACGEGGLQR